MKRKWQSLGFVLGLLAVLTLTAHAAHDHTPSQTNSAHACVVCKTPALGSVPQPVLLAPDFSLSAPAPVLRFVFISASILTSASPRAPPVA